MNAHDVMGISPDGFVRLEHEDSDETQYVCLELKTATTPGTRDKWKK